MPSPETTLNEQIAEEIWEVMRKKVLPLKLAAAQCGINPKTATRWRTKGREDGAEGIYLWFEQGCEAAHQEAVLKAVEQIRAGGRDRNVNYLLELYGKLFPELSKRQEMKVEHSGGIKFERIVKGLTPEGD